MPWYTIYGAWFIIIKIIQKFDEYKFEYIRVDKKKVISNTNIFGLNKKNGEYEYKFIWVDIKGRIWVQIFGLVFANRNTNTNISQTLRQRLDKFEYQKSVPYVSMVKKLGRPYTLLTFSQIWLIKILHSYCFTF